jgi:hypothetical protein
MQTKNEKIYFLIQEGNELSIETVSIIKSHEEEFIELLKKIKANYRLPLERLKYIINNWKFKSLLGRMNYCIDPNKAYQGFFKSIEEIIEQYSIPNGILNKSEFIEFQNKRLEEELLKRKEAYNYENTMKEITVFNLKNKSRAYSHCLVGWKTFKFNINIDLNFEAITNFGYGNSSYFYGKIIFKELQIIPYSDWIVYEKANLHEIINYTRKYEVNYKSWYDLFSFFIEVNNEIKKSESMFINKYIIKECEKMIEGLKMINKSNSFIFVTSERINLNKNKVGHELIEFRGEKISGALDFIKEIEIFSNYIDANRYKNEIEKLNIEIKSILKKELVLIDQKLDELNSYKLKLESELNKAKIKFENSEIERENYIKNQMNINNKNDKDTLSLSYNENNPKYKKYEIEYKKCETQIEENEAKLNSLNYIHGKINLHLDKIDTYFRDKLKRRGIALTI